MIRLLPLKEQSPQRKRNKSYSEGVKPLPTDSKSIQPHPRLQTSPHKNQIQTKASDECLSMIPSDKWEAKLENLEQLQQELKASGRKWRNQRGFFIALYSKHPHKVQRQVYP